MTLGLFPHQGDIYRSVESRRTSRLKRAWQLYAAPLSVTHFVRVHFPRLRGQLLVSGEPNGSPLRGAGNTPQGGLTEGLTQTRAAPMQPLRLLVALTATNAGWNMVVLQRCRLQYSLFRPILPSLHRPLGALGSNPPQAVAPFGVLYKPLAKTRGRTASLSSS